MKFKRNPTASPVFNKTSPASQDKMTTQEKYTQGMDNIISYIEENPDANKEDIRGLVIKHNRSLEGMDLKSSKNFTHAKIPVTHAWKFLPKNQKPDKEIKVDDKPTMLVGGAVKPGTIEEAERRFGSAIAPLNDPAKQRERDLFYQKNRIGATTTTYLDLEQNPIPKKRFKMPGFGKK